MTNSNNTTSNLQGEHGKGQFKGRGRIDQIVTELRRQTDARHDFVLDTRDLAIAVGENGEPRLISHHSCASDFIPRRGYPLLNQALNQVGNRAVEGGVPTRFLRRVWDANPKRMSEFLTGLMHDDPKRRLVRVLYDQVRAFLSQSYKCIDNLDIAEQALKVAMEHRAIPIEASISDSHMRLRFVSREIGEELQRHRTQAEAEGKNWFPGGLGSQDALRKVAAQSWGELPGDTIHPALGFKNSETGHGGCDLDGGILLGACFNLAWVRQMVHEVHLGERLEEGLFTAGTARKHADLIYSKINDASEAYFTEEHFKRIVANYEETQANVLRAPSVAVKVAVSACDSLNESDMDNLLSYFCEQPGSLSEFNLGQGISRMAQDLDPDRASEVEWFANRVCEGKLSKEIERATVKHALATA
jgi:hypothetical protein